MTLKPLLRIAGFLFVITSVVLSCKSDKKSSLDEALNIRIAKDAPSINPILYPNLLGREIYTYLFLPLADIDEKDLLLRPILIEKIPDIEVDKDGKYRLTIKLRQDAVWSDGKEITAEDILFTVKVIKHKLSPADQYRALLEPLSDAIINPSSNKELTFVFNEYLLNLKESILSMEILPKHIMDAQGLSDNLTLTQIMDEASEKDSTFVQLGNLLNEPRWNRDLSVSSGPYKLTKFEENAETILEKVKPYWGEKYPEDMLKSNAEKIIITVIPDEIAALSELSVGNIDVISDLSSQAFTTFSDTAKSSPNYAIHKGRLPRYYMLYLNHKSPILSDVNVRKALRCLTDVDAFITNFENGDATKMTSFVPTYMPGYNKNLKLDNCAIDQAKSILSQNGWQDSNANTIVDKNIGGKVTELSLQFFTSGPLSQKIGIILKDACQKAGIQLELVQKDFPLVMKENLSIGKYDIVPGVGSTDILMENPYDWYHTDNIGTSNLSNYSNPQADTLIDVIRSSKDNSGLKNSFEKLQQVIYDDVAILYLYSPSQRIIVRDKWTPTYTLKRPGYKANLFSPNEKAK